MFRFASPLFLLLLIVLPMLLYFRCRKKNSSPVRVAASNEVMKLSPSFAVRLSKILPLLKIVTLVLMILALARPQWGDKKVNITTEGVNIILALDLSGSMSALDFKKDGEIINRLDAVKAVARDFIMRRDGDRIGVVVFGTHAFTQLPLTRDYNTIAFVLERLEIGAAGAETAIGDSIGISLKRLKDIESKSNIIILLTDGKSNAGRLSWQDATRIAVERKVKIYTIGVGTDGEAPFLVDGPFGKQYVYQRVEKDSKALKTIAEQTGANFFEAQDFESLEKIYEIIERLEKTKVDVKKWVEYQEFYPELLFAGLGLLLVYILLSNSRFLKI